MRGDSQRARRNDYPFTDDRSPVHMSKSAVRSDAQTLKWWLNNGYIVPRDKRNPLRVRPFVAWDGEGITYQGNVEQSYVLFGNSDGDRITRPTLSTRDCFDLLLASEVKNPDAIHVGFALQYDINMILKDLKADQLERIYKRNITWYGNYRIEYRPRKWLGVRRGKTTVRLFDVFGFFQSSFVAAIEKFLGKNDPDVERIRQGKKERSFFRYDQLDDFIIPYWEAELRMMVRLMDALRNDLESAGFHLGMWHGPGAVANEVFKRYQIKKVMANVVERELPLEVNRAAQYAYAGGRFELFQCGHFPGTVYEYDINSAYPAAIAQLPNLANGDWRHSGMYEPRRFAVWHVRYDHSISGAETPIEIVMGHFGKYPLFCRSKHGTISYPPSVDTWVWGPEAAYVEPWITEGYVFEDDGSRPFAFIPEMYRQRQQWKREGNSAERAYKLALNSIYGKMAQRAGWNEEGDPIPKYHQLEWAGWVTSYVRAMIWDAICKNKDAIIATETDAIFSTEPLPLPCSDSLGEWGLTVFDWITYLQNGVYFGEERTKERTTPISRYRGYDKDSLSHGRVMDYLHRIDNGERNIRLVGVSTRFVGLGISLHTSKVWRSWNTEPRTVVIGGDGKRAHMTKYCRECKAGIGLAQGLHRLHIPGRLGGRSFPHPIPWLGETNWAAQMAEIDRMWEA